MRMIVRGIKNGETRLLKDLGLEGKKIKRVCTILNEEKMFQKYNTETGVPYKVTNLEDLNLQHWITVFYEDFMHDYTVLGEKFRFHAHSSDIGDVVDLLVEVE